MKFISIFKYVLIFLFVFFSSQKIYAQSNPYLSVSIKDSLLADEKSTFLYNHVTIFNTYNQIVSFTCAIDVPVGWSLLSENNLYVELAAGQSYALNITLNRQKLAEANWKKVDVKLCLKNSLDTNHYPFFVKTNPIKNFRARAIVREIMVTKNAKEVILPVRILNAGNIKQTFKLQYNNQKINLNNDVNIPLQPGKDTIYNYLLKIPQRIKKNIVKEEVYLTITGDKDKVGIYSYIITNMTSNRKVNKSAYETFPLNIETGIININNKYTGYFALGAAYLFKNNDKLLFNYQSKQFGIEGLQQNIFNVGYQHKKWMFYAGQVSEIGPFLNFGTGIKISYAKNTEEGFSVFANHSLQNYFKGSNVGLVVKQKIKKILFSTQAMANFDKEKNRNSYIIENKTSLINNKKILLDLNVGYGFAQNNLQARYSDQNTSGVSYGYHFRDALTQKISLKSTFQFNSDAYPGNYQGYRLQTHTIKWQPNKKINFSADYNLSYFKKSFFRDSIFYRSLLLANNQQIGINMGVTLFKKLRLDAGVGYMKNAVAEAENPPIYKFASAGINFQFLKKISFFTNGIIGYNSGFEDANNKVYLFSFSSGISCEYGGVQLQYDQVPSYILKSGVQSFNDYQNMLNIGPYLSKSFFRHTLEIRAQYNYSKRTPNDFSIENGALSVVYANQTLGLNVQLTGSSSINTATPFKYGMFTLRKIINVPKPNGRKFYDLKINLYNDENNDGIKNKEEKTLQGLEILVNEQPYISNTKGQIFIENTEPNKYEIDFHTIKNTNGLIPANGFRQTVNLKKNVVNNIPFKKGKIITGSIKIMIDSFSSQRFSADRLKITATDSLGEKYTTLTDMKGVFSLSVPSGKYVVSLNPQAFDDVFVPTQMAFVVNLINTENAIVEFIIKQKQRKVVMIKASVNK